MEQDKPKTEKETLGNEANVLIVMICVLFCAAAIASLYFQHLVNINRAGTSLGILFVCGIIAPALLIKFGKIKKKHEKKESYLIQLFEELGGQLKENPTLTAIMELVVVALVLYMAWILPPTTTITAEVVDVAKKMVVFSGVLGAFLFVAAILNGVKRTHYTRRKAEIAQGHERQRRHHWEDIIPVSLFILPPVLGVLGLLAAIEALGYDISTAVLASGVIGIVFGFALQDPLSNVFEGIILQYGAQHLREDDMVQLPDGRVCWITRFGIRATDLKSIYEEVNLRVPHTALANETLVLLDKPGTDLRISLPIGLAYGSDLSFAKLASERIAAADPTTVLTSDGKRRIEEGDLRELMRRFEASNSEVKDEEVRSSRKEWFETFIEQTAEGIKHSLTEKTIGHPLHEYQNPEAFFDSFAASSINFILAFYVDNVRGDGGLRVKKATTRIAVDISYWFTKLGIEIPFPATDLRLRDTWLEQHFRMTGIDRPNTK